MDQSPDGRNRLTPEDLAILDVIRRETVSLWVSLAIGIAVSVGLWFVWRPLGATVSLFTVGYSRRFFSHYGEFWPQSVAILVGIVVGIGIAALTMFVTKYSGVGWLGASWLGFLGFLSTGYIGYGVPNSGALASIGVDRNRITIGIFATISYFLAFAAALIFLWVTNA